MPSPSYFLPLPLGNHTSVLHVHDLLFCGKVHLCHVLDSRCKWYHMVTWYLSFSFWLTSLSRSVSKLYFEVTSDLQGMVKIVQVVPLAFGSASCNQMCSCPQWTWGIIWRRFWWSRRGRGRQGAATGTSWVEAPRDWDGLQGTSVFLGHTIPSPVMGFFSESFQAWRISQKRKRFSFVQWTVSSSSDYRLEGPGPPSHRTGTRLRASLTVSVCGVRGGRFPLAATCVAYRGWHMQPYVGLLWSPQPDHCQRAAGPLPRLQ